MWGTGKNVYERRGRTGFPLLWKGDDPMFYALLGEITLFYHFSGEGAQNGWKISDSLFDECSACL